MQALPWPCMHGLNILRSACSIMVACVHKHVYVCKGRNGEMLAWQAALSQEELGGAWQMDGPCICFGPHERGPLPSTPSW